MTFQEWMNKKSLTHVQAADLFGVVPSTIGRWENGTRFPSRELMAIIAEVTDGEVMPNDWFPTSAAAQ